jgi:MYXO-CTERM domain-containing protein
LHGAKEIHSVSHRFFALLALLLLGSVSGARADLITDWNQIAVQTANTLSSNANYAPRVLAITHIAIHNALAAIDKTHAPYATSVELTYKEPVSREAAVLGAAHYALSVLVPAKKNDLTAKLAAALAKLPNDAAQKNGLDLGVAAADAIISARASDGSLNTEAPYLGSEDAGKWRPTGKDANNNPVPGVDPHWRKLVPFALSSPADFRAAEPPAVNSPQYLADLAEVRSLGGSLATSTTPGKRTLNQTEIAKFWENSSHIPFNAVARQISKEQNLTLAERARLFAQLNIAMSDARVAVWDSKYFYSAWRPITAIVTGDGAEDDGSTTDAEWVPYLATPAHPEYPSGHSTTGAAAVAVLKAWFGDEVPFTVASESLPEVTRSYTTLSQAALENGRSRIYGGIHFNYANLAGQQLGKSVGEHVLATQLLELPPAVIDAGVDAGSVADASVSDAGPGSATDAGTAQDAAVADAGASSDAGRDAGELADAGSPAKDAGTTPVLDGGSNADAGGSSKDDSSSSCAVTPGQRVRVPLWVALVAGILWPRRRRRQPSSTKTAKRSR